jgi:bifunctional UDP-N-acetylglucosamine pyrophosphorylase/glucosamine-1-phosphate N-acetyltransferase
MHHNSQASVTVLTSILENPKGYGKLFEAKMEKMFWELLKKKMLLMSKKKSVRLTQELCLRRKVSKRNLSKIDNKNSQGEYYLTDLLKIANETGHKTAGYILKDPAEALGINDRRQLAQASQILLHRKINQLMIDGVTFIDPDTAYIESQVEISPDVIIYPNVIIEGNTTIGEDNTIGPDTRIIDSKI